MKIIVQGKQVNVGSALSDYVHENVQRVIAKYFETAIDATVLFYKDSHLFCCDINVRAGQDITMRSHGEDTEPYKSFDSACDKVEKRARRNKRRLKNYRSHGKNWNDQALVAQTFVIDASQEQEKEDVSSNLVIAESPTNVLFLSPSEAVMRLDLSNENALLFKNRAHGGFNVVYRRQDGNIGWIDPSI